MHFYKFLKSLFFPYPPKTYQKHEHDFSLEIIINPLFNSQTFFAILLFLFFYASLFVNHTSFSQIGLKTPFSFFYASFFYVDSKSFFCWLLTFFKFSFLTKNYCSLFIFCNSYLFLQNSKPPFSFFYASFFYLDSKSFFCWLLNFGWVTISNYFLCSVFKNPLSTQNLIKLSKFKKKLFIKKSLWYQKS